MSWWQASSGGNSSNDGHGVGDTTLFLKARFLVQDPDSWVPSLTVASFVALPTSDWFSTPSVPGGFGTASRNALRAPELTEALLFRKNVKPFRISGGLYYSYGIPTSTNGTAQRYGTSSNTAS